MDTNQGIRLIDNIAAALAAVVKDGLFQPDDEPITSAGKVINLLKIELIRHPQQINERVLRSTIDVSVSSYKDFENTPVETAIDALIEWLYYTLPGYKDMEPLREEFDTGEPI